MALRLLVSALARQGRAAAPVQLQALAGARAAQQQLAPAAAEAAAAAAAAPHARTAAAAAAFSTSGRALSESLSSLLQRELKHEQTTYEQPEAVAKGPPAPFTLTSAPGDGTVSLKRDFNGETITIDASVNMQDGLAEDGDEGEEGEEGEDEFGAEVSFNVTVTKGDSALVFECTSDGSYLEIRHVSHEPAGGLDSETAYTGPVFDELADPVRDGFAAYLEARGVSEDVGEFLRHALYDKEQREYITWLQRVAGFVAE